VRTSPLYICHMGIESSAACANIDSSTIDLDNLLTASIYKIDTSGELGKFNSIQFSFKLN